MKMFSDKMDSVISSNETYYKIVKSDVFEENLLKKTRILLETMDRHDKISFSKDGCIYTRSYKINDVEYAKEELELFKDKNKCNYNLTGPYELSVNYGKDDVALSMGALYQDNFYERKLDFNLGDEFMRVKVSDTVYKDEQYVSSKQGTFKIQTPCKFRLTNGIRTNMKIKTKRK